MDQRYCMDGGQAFGRLNADLDHLLGFHAILFEQHLAKVDAVHILHGEVPCASDAIAIQYTGDIRVIHGRAGMRLGPQTGNRNLFPLVVGGIQDLDNAELIEMPVMGQKDAPLSTDPQRAEDRVAVGADVDPLLGRGLGQREHLSPLRPCRDLRRTRKGKPAPIAREQQIG